MLLEKSARLVGVIGDEAHDGGVGGVENAERDDMDPRLRENLHDVEQPPDLVFHENGKLPNLLFHRPLLRLQFGRIHVHKYAATQNARG